MMSMIIPALYSAEKLQTFWVTQAAVRDYESLFRSERCLPWTEGHQAATAIPRGDGRLPWRAADCATLHGRSGWPWLINSIVFVRETTPIMPVMLGVNMKQHLITDNPNNSANRRFWIYVRPRKNQCATTVKIIMQPHCRGSTGGKND